MPCDRCRAKTKKGQPCKRNTCLLKNVPYCWQHIPKTVRRAIDRREILKHTTTMRTAPRGPTYDHVRSFTANADELLVPVYDGKSGWSGQVYQKKGKVLAHYVLRVPRPLGRFVRFTFDDVSLREFRKVPQGPDAVFIASIGATGPHKKRVLKTLLGRVTARPLYLRSADRTVIQVATEIGFRVSPELTEGEALFMYRT